MDRFSFFFAFYGLILGLAVTEILSGFAGYARERRIRDLEPQTALLALLVFIDICATWIDAWESLRGVTLNFAALWAPILTATCFYLAASLAFPREPGEYDQLGDYYSRRSGFVAAMLLAAEVFITFTFADRYQHAMAERPAIFWLWHLPYKIALLALFASLVFVRGKRANLTLLAAVILVFTVPYWTYGAIPAWIHKHFDQPA